ncbi:DNA polymerase [Human mastadenovirus B]|uniref:DNA polymerase n=5 Tax=Human mastadenovirus B TaxID=108098 RepID=T1UFI5_9ADEN|nr:pol [Human adenovirus 35]AGT75712.1 DNA polymerase [Human mastadenovirus B]WEG77710.1 pol [Human adenovirus 35]WOW72181.1 pol protein [Human adenovirus 35]
MALVQAHGAGSFHPETSDTRRQSTRGGARKSSQSAIPEPARARRRRATTSHAPGSGTTAAARRASPSPLLSMQEAREPPPIKRKNKGTVVAPKGHGTLQAIDVSTNEPVEIKYHLNLPHALEKIMQVNLLSLPTNLSPQRLRTLDSSSLRALVLQLRPSRAEVWTCLPRGLVSMTTIETEDEQADTANIEEHEIQSPGLGFPLKFLVKGSQVQLIHEIQPVQRCDYCGRLYKHKHECSARRRNFYFHHINSQSSNWWQEIQFFPIGSHPRTERLFLTYDVETYTWMGSFGKQLVPFMLVMKLSGEERLVNMAHDLAIKLKWDRWQQDPRTFYCVTPEKMAIGRHFRQYRDQLQTALAVDLWSSFLHANPHLHEWALEHYALSDPTDLTFDELSKLPHVRGTPRFIELYIVGHNINGFDEIVLAAQVINNRAEVPQPFRITRNFMPRAGKILFNDVTFALPNPAYKKRVDFQLWEQGACDDMDFKYQFLKVMVRDTFALTHASLRKAAQAYSLPVEKGCCPYKAVNQFYMLGSYRADKDGFPLEEYWKDREEYLLNRELWEKKNQPGYDIIQETLDYCALDVLVTAELVTKLQESYAHFVRDSVGLPHAHFNIFQRPTISSNSHAIFRQIVYRTEKPNRTNLGPGLLAPSHELYDYVRASIRGGRCYPTYIGIFEDPIYVYDICGMYASALTHPMPWGSPLNPYERALAAREWQMALDDPTPISYFDKDLLPGIFTMDADPPDELMLDPLPPFCSRKGGRLCWTNEPLRGEVATSVDLITLHNRGWQVRIVPDELTTIFPEWKCLAREYVQLNIAAKERADKEKNQTMRSIAKLLSNALYGSFATKLDNKKIVFSDQMDENLMKGISTGTVNIKSSSFLETDNLSAEVMPAFEREYLPQQLTFLDSDPEDSEEEQRTAPFYTPPAGTPGHVKYTYKPITFLDVEEGDMCLHTLEKVDPLVDNDRYPSHIASFVLAWTRAFVSEWSEFLYEEDRGTPLEKRPVKSVYGDTDSLFVTQRGHELMETKGKKRIKKYGGKLVFDPNEPDLTWLVECETVCASCGADAYSPESIFLAPKLYALKCLYCPVCKKTSKGKLRAKGHAAEALNYELMVNCYLADIQGAKRQKFSTSRMSLKRTLASAQAGAHPFTVTETTLTRTLRPWKDRTLAALDAHRLIPYSRSRPNPRNEEVCWIEMP